MMYPDSFDISFAFSYFYFISGIAFAVLFTLFNYRITIPAASAFEKTLLIFLRTASLILILAAIFEPVAELSYKNIDEPKNVLFVDNSRSVVAEDSLDGATLINGLIQEFSALSSSVVYTFSDKVYSSENSAADFSGTLTNFKNISEKLKEADYSVNSVTILSDGIITEGESPLYDFEKSGIKINTIGIGSTTVSKDIAVTGISQNRYIYKDKETSVIATIRNNGFSNDKVVVSFYEDNELKFSKTITLNSGGINKVSFPYTPAEAGDKRLRFTVSAPSADENRANNSRSKFIKVLDNKLKVLLLAGTAGSDYSFIKNVLLKDENIELSEFISLKNGKNIGAGNPVQKADSADVIFTISFPSANTSQQLIQQIINTISRNNTPLFTLLSSGIDVRKLRLMKDVIPVTVKSYRNSFEEVQPIIKDNTNPVMFASGNIPAEWENLPPVFASNSLLDITPGVNILAGSTVNGIDINKPLLMMFSAGRKRNIIVNATDIWRWKLQQVNKNLTLFDSFIQNSVKWLTVDKDKKKVNIRTNKKIYNNGENILFTAEVFDDLFNPVDDAEVNISLGNNENILLNSAGNGIYEGTIKTSQSGLVRYSSVVKTGDSESTASGSISIGEADIEKTNLLRNETLLRNIADYTGGAYIDAKDADSLITAIKSSENTNKRVYYTSEKINLWSDTALLFAIIILLSIEWLLRKRSGML